MSTTMIRPDDRTPEERLRDAIDEAQAEAFAERQESPYSVLEAPRFWTPLRLGLGALTLLWAGTMYHIGDSYSPRVAWLCILCTAWGIASGFLLTFDWLQHGQDRE